MSANNLVRKQIYLRRQQDRLLKKLARQRGVSEAEVIRQALEREASLSVPVARDSREALERIVASARALRERPELLKGKPYQFNREEIYTERASRWRKPGKKR